MKFLASFTSVLITALLVSVKCTDPILSEMQKDIWDLSADMINMKRKMDQDLQDRNQLILKLNQTISRYDGTYERSESMHLDWFRALVKGSREEKNIPIKSMMGLPNLYQENHELKQELKSVIGVLKTLTVEIQNQSQQLKELQDQLQENKNQSQQLKELQDQMKELKASEKDLRTSLTREIKNQSQQLKGIQDELQENKNQSQQLKELQDQLKELKASEKDLYMRLVQNDSLHASEGRIEIFYDGEWGTVCDDRWDDNDATVVCRMLGFSYGNATFTAYFGEGSGRILLDEVVCKGNELRLDDCQYAWRRHDCGHDEDAGVICKHLTSPDARLQFDRFEILHNGQWGTVCDDEWDARDATVACRMLDYRYGYTRNSQEASRIMLLDNVNCIGNESSIKECQHDAWGIHDCTQTKHAGILCRDFGSNDLRLTGGGFPNKGRLEVFHRGHWGTVCDDGWDEKDATVACRMLGFTYGKATIQASFGQGSGRIWLDDVRCKGNETNLEDCQHGGWGRENCFHHEDAGVVCR